MNDRGIDQDEENLPGAITVIIVVMVLLVVSAVLLAVWLMEFGGIPLHGSAVP